MHRSYCCMHARPRRAAAPPSRARQTLFGGTPSKPRAQRCPSLSASMGRPACARHHHHAARHTPTRDHTDTQGQLPDQLLQAHGRRCQAVASTRKHAARLPAHNRRHTSCRLTNAHMQQRTRCGCSRANACGCCGLRHSQGCRQPQQHLCADCTTHHTCALW